MTMRTHSRAWRVSCAGILIYLSASAFALGESTREWRFNVSLDGRPIGEHRFVLRESQDRRELTSDAQFRVRVLFIDAYRYEHRARESWRGDCLERLDARTDSNGTQVTVSGERNGDEFRVSTGSSVEQIDRCVQTFAYWNAHILESDRLLNPQTGEYIPIQVIGLGPDAIAGHDDARRFRLLGKNRDGTPLEIDLWYTPANDWLALESRMADGRRLRYTRD